MLITKIIAKNFKTYRELDLDLTVNEETDYTNWWRKWWW